MCPKQISELKNAQRNVTKVGGKKVDFGAIVQKIVVSKQYWTVQEIWTGADMVNKKVGRFRTMKLLNGASMKGGKLERLYQDGRFYYGPATTAATVTK